MLRTPLTACPMRRGHRIAWMSIGAVVSAGADPRLVCAGVSIDLDGHSRSHYHAGRTIPWSSPMRCGGLIFYGRDAGQHEAKCVHTAPVGTSGALPSMTPLGAAP
ncbi:hypothetical protein OKHIL_47950 [Mycolicibacterium mageritense]|nr:hypothetical protein MTY414_70960 [Mycolicibacterium mageritense]